MQFQDIILNRMKQLGMISELCYQTRKLNVRK